MDATDRLQSTLHAVNAVTLARLHPVDPIGMRSELEKLKSWLGTASRLDRFPALTIERALEIFRKKGHVAGTRGLLLVCHGAAQGEDALIESRGALERLLGMVERYRARRRTFRRLYKALLDCSFSHDPKTPGSTRLRAFLSKHLESFVITEFSPDWLVTLKKHPELLGDDPAGSLLQTDWPACSDALERLDLGGDSWLVRELVMSRIHAAESMDDASFRDQLPILLLMLDAYPLLAPEGLKIILDRHGQKGEVDDALGEFAIGLWGNPWLAPQQWPCSEPAREMMARWLRRLLLEEFFGILSDDDRTRHRRLDFWDLYCDDMKGMYFVLGQDAYASDDMGLYRFRRHAKGLIARFPEDRRGMQACIMQFEHHHVVEFNSEDSAAYFYDASQGMPSFYFGRGWVDIGAIGAQQIMQGTSSLSRPMRHLDSLQLAWEGKFAALLGETDSTREAFCNKYQCRRDGARIIPENHERYGREVWSVLLGWGYVFSEREGAFVKQS